MQKNNLKTGDIILYKDGNCLFSKIIKLVTNSKYNHAGIYLHDGKVAESLTDGFKLINYNNLEQYQGVDFFRFKSKINDTEIKKQIVKNLNMGYGFLDLIKILIWKITGKQLFKKNSQKLICSEAVAKCYRDAGFDLFPEIKNLDYITPDDLSKCKKVKEIFFD